MTRRVGPVVIVEKTAPQKCELCGNEAETKPYGPNGEQVCFPCGMKNEDAAKRRFNEFVTGKKGS